MLPAEPFHEQPIWFDELVALQGYPLGQAEKKSKRPQRIDNDSAVFERLSSSPPCCCRDREERQHIDKPRKKSH